MIYATSEPDGEDQQVLEQIHGFRTDLADVMGVPKRWLGALRRSMLVPVGETKGRHYVMGERLAGLRQVVLEKRPQLVDPYQWMRGRLASVAAPVR